MMRINIISCNNGVGLSRDVEIMTNLLRADGHEVTFSDLKTSPSGSYDLNIFGEIIKTGWFELAKKNILLPNPEWYDNRWADMLPKFSMVLCKTKYAEGLFRARKCPTTFISFTSPDRFLEGIPKDDMKFFHLAGKSTQKGTEMVIRCWERNPAFPTLTILQDPSKWRRRITVKNICYIHDRLPEYVLKVMQNAYGTHVCPSETEGFGHYIMEGLSAGSIVVTTNGPPMNEIVTPERGILCDYLRQSPQHLATNYYVSELTLAHGIRRSISMSDAQRQSLRKNARDFFLQNDAFFKLAFIGAIRRLQ